VLPFDILFCFYRLIIHSFIQMKKRKEFLKTLKRSDEKIFMVNDNADVPLLTQLNDDILYGRNIRGRCVSNKLFI